MKPTNLDNRLYDKIWSKNILWSSIHGFACKITPKNYNWVVTYVFKIELDIDRKVVNSCFIGPSLNHGQISDVIYIYMWI